MRATLVQLRGVTKYFDHATVLQNVDLEIKQNTLLALIGRSGAGKTTLLRIILGIYKPDFGTLTKANIKIGYASQENSFYPRLTVDENLDYFGKLYGVSGVELENRKDELLKLVKLIPARSTRAQNLSGGMKRRLDLALALIHDPELIILDEPTAGLDVVLQKQIWQNILAIKKSKKTIIISSHDLDQLRKYCDEFAFVYNKQLYDLERIKKTLKIKTIARLERVFE